MSYRLFVKEPDEIRGTKVDDFDSIEDVRAAVRAVLEDRPDGTFAYVYRAFGRVRPIEAYEVRDGEIRRIFTRYGGGEWPVVWSPGWERSYDPDEPTYGTWKESKEEFLKVGPQKESMEGERYTPYYERKFSGEEKKNVRSLLRRLEVI